MRRMLRLDRYATLAILTIALLSLTSCAGGGGVSPMAGNNTGSTLAGPGSALVDTDNSPEESDEDAGNSILKRLNTITTIGSTVDPINGDVNPYGLDIAKANVGALSAGDLVVCNFNDSANVQGTGTTIISLHPVAGATPTHIAQDASLLGCNAI